MASEIRIRGEKARKGERLRMGKGWRLVAVKGRNRVFTATLLSAMNFGGKRLAIFSVPK